ncbi:MarR family transcriptional regulator [Mucilaginibacter sp. BT774]|nr:MarR family transcriptional regulator [Mucilaginibacter sp. BT774]
MIAHIGALYHKIHRQCDKIFRENGFPLEMDQIPVLMRLYYSGSASQQEIGLGLGRDKASVNRTIALLAKKDFARVLKDATDKRKTSIELTETGKKLAAQAHAMLETFNKSLVSQLTKEERTQFNSLAFRLIEAITSL